MEKVINTLINALNEEDFETIRKCEKLISQKLDEAVNTDLFYELPINVFLKIIDHTEFSQFDEPYEIAKKLVEKLSQFQPKAAPLLLNVLKVPNATYNELVEIMSRFSASPISKALQEAIKEEQVSVEVDYNFELQKKDETIKNLKEQGYSLKENRCKIKPIDFEPNIFRAAELDKRSSVDYLINNGVDKEKKDSNGQTALQIATIRNHLSVVQCLVENGANINTQDNYGMTPLHRACMYGYVKIVEYLIQHGANLTIKDDKGLTPIQRTKGKSAVNLYLQSLQQQNVNKLNCF